MMDEHQKKLFQGAAAVYAWILPCLQKVGRELGYAVAVHGSLQRDLDVLCAPWTDKAVSAKRLVDEFHKRLGGRLQPAVQKPHGRKAWAIVLDRTHFYVDVSVMPRSTK